MRRCTKPAYLVKWNTPLHTSGVTIPVGSILPEKGLDLFSGGFQAPLECAGFSAAPTVQGSVHSFTQRLGVGGLADNAEAALSSLSGGRRQIAYIAMALAQNTDYILLDEPTTYLDISHQLSIMKMLKKLSLNGKGIITVMHDLPMAFSFSDKIVIINNGKIVYQGAPENIYNSELIKAIFGISIKRIAGEYSYDLRGKFD